MFNIALNYSVESRGFSLQARNIDVDSLHNRAYDDASFAINQNLSSQFGYIVLLFDK